MKFTLLVLVFTLLSFNVFSQDLHFVKGYVIDVAENTKLENTSILVLNAKDSTLVNFSRADKNGDFSIRNLKKGNFILWLTYPGYADYTEHFKLDSTKNHIDFGKIDLVLKSRLLAEVVVKGQTDAIKIKGDTTEYNASSFVIQPNSKVEDLIKQFPGIQVDKDGKITAHGETVTKVLVDGEEFFGDDPTLVTKNLRADMVDKVQLYDKKSDQAAFTGIDDGEKNKTLNIKLKDDKKNGFFGKVNAGQALDYYEQQLMFNAFTAKQKLSIYGTNSNTSTTGLNWSDSRRFGSTNSSVSDEGYIYSYSDRDDINYNGRGIPETRSMAMHYDTKWNDKKKALNLNYKLGDLNIKGNGNNLSKNTLPSGVINNNSEEIFDNYFSRQKIDVVYSSKVDSTAELKITLSASSKNTNNTNSYESETFKNENTLQNTSERENSSTGKNENFNSNIFWAKKLKKKRRTVSINTGFSTDNSNSEGYLNSKNTFYNPILDNNGIAVIDSINYVDQLKINDSKGINFNTNITYTEPITKYSALVFNYKFGLSDRTSNRESYNKSTNGKYDLLDSLYSNHFDLKEYSHQTGVNFNYQKDKTTLNFGTRVSKVDFNQLDTYTSNKLNRNFINYNPSLRYGYKFSQQRSFYINYNGNSSQPSVNQVQPIRNNNDPLNIYLGNPYLKPSFSSYINTNYNSYKVLTRQYFYASGSFGFTNNNIVNYTQTDSVGKSIYQYINLKDKTPTNYGININFSKEVKFIDANIGLGLGQSGSTVYNYINDKLNEMTNNQTNLNINLSKYKKKKYDFYLSFGPRYSTRESSIQKQTNNNGWNLDGNASFRLYLPIKIEFAADANYIYTEKTNSFSDDFERLLINASLQKKFLKTDNLIFSANVKDLLNQNTGFSRGGYGNTISQSSYNTIKRYFLFSLIWEFNKMGGSIKSTSKTNNEN